LPVTDGLKSLIAGFFGTSPRQEDEVRSSGDVTHQRDIFEDLVKRKARHIAVQVENLSIDPTHVVRDHH